jgi:L-histidine N-alpha-methyltransferase
MNFSKKQETTNELIPVRNYLPEKGLKEIREELATGLKSPRKYISSKFFYDKKGSELFDEITRLNEYYPTRTEKAILRNISPHLAKELADSVVIELGSGSSSKISILFEAYFRNNLNSLTYVPVDISRSVLEISATGLMERFPGITIEPIVADFTNQLHVLPKEGKKVICFFGSTIGNFTRTQASRFLNDLASRMKPNDELLLGIDRVKDKTLLENAYNDSKQITSAFNKNILSVVNILLLTNFNAVKFDHLAFYNEKDSRIEMHLIARENMEISSPHLKEIIRIKKGENIHTENSHKFTDEHISEIVRQTGLHIKNVYNDKNEWFSICHFCSS